MPCYVVFTTSTPDSRERTTTTSSCSTQLHIIPYPVSMTAHTFTIHLNGSTSDFAQCVEAVGNRAGVDVSGWETDHAICKLYEGLASRHAPHIATFTQLEETVHLHLHCVFEASSLSGTQKRSFLSAVRSATEDLLRSAGRSFSTRSIQFLRQRNGSHRSIVFIDFVRRYLLTKKERKAGVEGWVCRTHSNVPVEWLTVDVVPVERPENKDMSVMSNKAYDFETCLAECVKAGVGDSTKLRQRFPVLYLNKMSGQGGKQWLKMLMEMSRDNIIHDGTLADYLGDLPPQVSVPDNIITRIMMNNQICPGFFCANLYRWASMQCGKRNTMFFYGPASTGKTLICQALSEAAPFYGNVNKNNENFPFNDCTNQALVWWEEASISGKNVEDAKALMGGTQMRIDRKGGDSVTVPPTPVMMTSNNEVWYVVNGNSITTVHEAPLKSRWVRYNLNNKCDTMKGFQYPDVDEATNAVAECISWGKANFEHVPVEDMRELPWALGDSRWRGKKITVSNWSSSNVLVVQESRRQEEEPREEGEPEPEGACCSDRRSSYRVPK